MRAAAVVPALLAASLLSCGNDLTAPEDLPPTLRPPAFSPSGWERFVRDDFSFAVPPGFVKHDVTPIDSDVGVWGRGDASLMYDYGAYTGPWREGSVSGATDVQVARTEIGGKVAQIVTWRSSGRRVVRAWWGGVADGGALGSLDLLVQGSSASEADHADLLATIHSVRFD